MSGSAQDTAAKQPHRSLSTTMQPTVFEPMDRTTAEALLKEAKQILDRLGLVFFLRHGSVFRRCGITPSSNGTMTWTSVR